MLVVHGFIFISHELQAKPIVGDNKWNWTMVILSTSSWGKVWTTMLFLKRLAIWNWWPMYIEINNSQPHSLLYSHNCHPFLYHCQIFFISIYPFYTIIFFPLSTISIFLFITDLFFPIAIPLYHIRLRLKLQLENREPKNYTLYIKIAQSYTPICVCYIK